MTEEIRKPAAWEKSTFDDLLSIEAGQAYVVEQFGGSVEPEHTFKSNRANADACSYDLFEDNSLWFHSNSEDEVWVDVLVFAQQFHFRGVWWEDSEDRDGFIVDAMDRELLVHLWGEDEAREFFELAGGTVPVWQDAR